ncbi:MAG: PA14 domain-containing protein [Proteobacteria bacterium]|nr:PA14 domain-containing protein [Pseudomonadota bacterium]
MEFDWEWEWGSPDKSISGNQFSARWTAAITPRKTGEHTFRIAFTQAARVYLDDALIYDHWPADANQARLIDDTVRKSLRSGIESYATFSNKISKVTAVDSNVSNPDIEVLARVKNTGAQRRGHTLPNSMWASLTRPCPGPSVSGIQFYVSNGTTAVASTPVKTLTAPTQFIGVQRAAGFTDLIIVPSGGQSLA